MGIFGKKEEVVPFEVVRPKLAQKDGNLHILMVNTWSAWTEQRFNCDEKYTGELEQVLVGMQAAGYEIVGMQHNSLSSGGGFGVVNYTTMITYR